MPLLVIVDVMLLVMGANGPYPSSLRIVTLEICLMTEIRLEIACADPR